MIGDTTTRRIHIYDLNHVQYEGEGKYQVSNINIIHVVHDKEMFFNDETFDRNLIHLPNLFEAELQ